MAEGGAFGGLGSHNHKMDNVAGRDEDCAEWRVGYRDPRMTANSFLRISLSLSVSLPVCARTPSVPLSSSLPS